MARGLLNFSTSPQIALLRPRRPASLWASDPLGYGKSVLRSETYSVSRALPQIAFLVALSLGLAALEPADAASKQAPVIPLDGTWEIQRGGPDQPSTAAEGQVPVPGLTDMAVHANGVGDYWWYQRTFQLDTLPVAVALLKINKAMFGTRVFLNGHQIDEYLSSFSPSYHDVRPWLNFSGANVLVIRVG